MLLNTSELGKLAPIGMVMLPEALIMKRLAAAFEWKAGCPFINCFAVSLQINTILSAGLIKPFEIKTL